MEPHEYMIVWLTEIWELAGLFPRLVSIADKLHEHCIILWQSKTRKQTAFPVSSNINGISNC